MKYISGSRLSTAVKWDSDADQRFCFILGAGASKTSGIRTGRDLIPVWRKKLLEISNADLGYIRDCAESAGYEWSECAHIFDKNYQIRSEDYFTIYDMLYVDTVKAGYDFLENEMAGASPSIGYYSLANILANTRNKLVVTTNFDSLTEDALFLSSGNHPLVLGHERLAPFLDANINRPVVAKIHRDLLLEPMSHKKEMEKLKEEWRKALRSILPNYIPIVIGYAGGDNTLMGLLREEDIQCRKLYWCTHASTDEPSEEIQEIILKHNGQWVVIEGFDELMNQMATAFNCFPDVENMEKTTTERLNQFKATLLTSSSHPKLYNNLLQDAEKFMQTGATESAKKRCREAINLHSDRSEAYSILGRIYFSIHQHEEALNYFNKAISLDTRNHDYLYHRAVTLRALSRQEEALNSCSMAITYYPGEIVPAKYYILRGEILHALSRFESALSNYQKAKDLEPKNPQVYYLCAETYSSLDRPIDAAASLKYARSLKSESEIYM